MATNFVKAVLFQKNQIPLWNCPKTVSVPCGNIDIRGVEWWVPVVGGGVLSGYRRWLGDSPASSPRPQPDAVKTLRVVDLDGNDTLWILINTTDDETSFVSNCNGCCGATPVMDAVTIPDPINETCGCKNDAGNYVYDFPIPDNPNSLKYLGAGTINGVALAALSGAGYTTPANLLTAVSANWGASGTWTLTAGNKALHLVSTTAACVNVNVTLHTAIYCLTLPVHGSPLNVNGIKFGTTVVPFPTISVSVDNPQDLINAIRPFLVGTLVTAGTGPKIQYTGLQVPVEIDIDGTLAGSMSFSVGACS